MGTRLWTGLEGGWLDPVTDCTLLVVVLRPLVVTDGLVVLGTDTGGAKYLLAVLYFLSLFLRFPLVLVQADFLLTVQCGLTEFEGPR